jgi:hypothetical protein
LRSQKPITPVTATATTRTKTTQRYFTRGTL